MQRHVRRTLLVIAVFSVFVIPIAVSAGDGFTDVDNDNVFHADIDWLAAADVTKGCNPPTNTLFCPKDNVTREQMAAFMHRLAINKVVDAATAVTAENADNATNATNATNADDADNADNADNADLLDGLDSSDFVTHGEIVTSIGGGAWIANSGLVPTVSHWAGTTQVANGAVELELQGPAMLGGVDYGLQSVTYCIQSVGGGAFVDRVRVYPGSNSTSFIANDDSNRTVNGCYSLDVGHSGETYSMLIVVSGSSLRVGGMEAHWVPVADLTSVSPTGVDGSDPLINR